MGKNTSILFLMLLGFAISYIFSSAFAYYDLSTTNLLTGIIIVGLTFSIVSLVVKLFSYKTAGES